MEHCRGNVCLCLYCEDIWENAHTAA